MLKEIPIPTIINLQRMEIVMRVMLKRLECDSKLFVGKTEQFIHEYLKSPSREKLKEMDAYYCDNLSSLYDIWLYSFYQCAAYPDAETEAAIVITDSIRTEFPNDEVDTIKIIHEVVDRPAQQS